MHHLSSFLLLTIALAQFQIHAQFLKNDQLIPFRASGEATPLPPKNDFEQPFDIRMLLLALENCQ